MKAYRKYGIPLPETLDAMHAAAGSSTGKTAVEDKAAGGGGGGIAAEIEGLLSGLTGGGNAGAANAATGNAGAAAGSANAKSSSAAGTGKTATHTASAGLAKSTGGSAATSNGTAGSGVVAATPEQGDVEYLAPISIGGQTMNMDFDSGSSDLWVFNTQLSTASQTGHTNFNPSKSTTFKLIQGASSFSISYGDGSGAAGTVGTDTVNIGGATVTSQAIELATAVSSSFVTRHAIQRTRWPRLFETQHRQAHRNKRPSSTTPNAHPRHARLHRRSPRMQPQAPTHLEPSTPPNSTAPSPGLPSTPPTASGNSPPPSSRSARELRL
jgi:hypothetical protein